MNLDRLRWGEWIAAIAALDLLLVTFRAWYKVSGTDAHVTAWDALERGRYLLIATAIVGIFLLLIKAAEDTQQLSFPPGWISAAVGFVCTVYVAYRLVTPPSDNLDPVLGLYLGLLSALGVTVGGLLSARETEAVSEPRAGATDTRNGTGDQAPGEPFASPAATGGTWTPAAPTASTSGWTGAAAPAAAVPPATAAGALAGERPLRAGDSVVLTAGGARFPAGTVAEVAEVFAGGALVEVRAPDGMAERFEVPESAYERAGTAGAPAGGAGAAGGESWSPAMPAPASEDWGFDEAQTAAGAAGTATGAAGLAGDEPQPPKVPWWKREIGGGKKKESAAAEIGAAGAVATGAAAVAAGTNGTSEHKPGFFKRIFGGGKEEPQTETIEPETTPASDVAGVGQAAESDTAVDEPAAQSESDTAVDEPAAQSAVDEAPSTVEAEPTASDPAPEATAATGAAATSMGAPAAAAPEPEAAAPAADPEPTAPEADPEPATSASEPPASAAEPEVAAEPEPPAAPEPEVIASEEPAAASEPEVAATPDPEPPAAEPAVPDVEPGAEAAGAGAAAAAAASAGAGDEPPAPKRKRSSGSRKVPKELRVTADEPQPRVGDEVQLKVGGGRFDAGTRGTVVDVFSAGVIVELSDDAGRTERLDLPFEAIAPADA